MHGMPVMTVALGASLGIGATRACASGGPERAGPGEPQAEAAHARARAEMVERQIVGRGVQDPVVLLAMRKVLRHEFVPARVADQAYADRPLPIGWQQTISQPYIVALMTEVISPRPGMRVLEIGTGSGYQAAVLRETGAEVYSIEIVAPLAEQASATLGRLGYGSVHMRTGDGYQGWPEAAPFDAIVVTAAPPAIPPPLKEQLKIGGRLVLPVGTTYQELRVITRTREGWDERTLIPVIFVPMTGEAQIRR